MYNKPVITKVLPVVVVPWGGPGAEMKMKLKMKILSASCPFNKFRRNDPSKLLKSSVLLESTPSPRNSSAVKHPACMIYRRPGVD